MFACRLLQALNNLANSLVKMRASIRLFIDIDRNGKAGVSTAIVKGVQSSPWKIKSLVRVLKISVQIATRGFLKHGCLPLDLPRR
jgi:hypothetical protein